VSADTARLASQHHKLGKPGGPGLFHDKSLQLPAYIQNVAKALMRNGKSKSQAIQIAIGTVKNWAEGKGNVSPEVRAAAAKAVAEWEAAKAKARATPNKGASLSNPFDLANSAADVTPRMGMVALEVPAGTIAPLDGGTPADDMHITLAFLGEDVDDKTLARAIAYAYDASHRRPLSGTVGGLGTFPPKDDGSKMPVWCPVSVPGVNDLASQFRSLNVSTTGYVPHITLAFMPEGSKLPDPVPITPVTLSNLIVKRGDQVFRFPMGEGYDDSPRESAFGRLKGKAIELANKAKKSAKPAKGDEQSAKFGEPSLPPGATGWKHGWIPVNSSGKPVGPAQKPKWLIEDEKKHAAAGGKTAAEQRAIAGAKELAAPKKAAAAKAKAEAKHKAALARQAANKEKSAKAHEAAQAKHEASVKATAAHKAEREKAAKEKERQRQIAAAYKQAQADLKAGRALTPQQQRVVAYVEAQNKKQADANRKVDVAGQKVTAPKTPAATVAKKAATTAKKAATAKPAPKVKRRSYKNAAERATALANVPWGVNVIDLAGNSPKGHLAFRYKHNWILINPAIPSRGKFGGGLAKQHGHKSGGITHGHFENHPSGKGKVFVPDRHGGQNNPAKLKAAHTKSIGSAKPEQSGYKLAANKQAPKGDALKPATPSPEMAKQKSIDANAASATANKTKSVADAQVAAKKHADAFVAHKKVGNEQAAAGHKANAQAWAKKAQQLKSAEKATQDAKAKYEAEQKAKAADEKANAEKAAAEQKAKTKAAQQKALDLLDEADKLSKLADKMPENNTPAMKAKAQQHKYAAEKWQELADHQKANGFTVGPQLEGKIASHQKSADELNKKAAEFKTKMADANKMGEDAFHQTLTANDANTPEAHKAAALAHQKAGKAYQELGLTGDQTMHFDAATKHMKKSIAQTQEAEKAKAAAKAAVPPAPSSGMGPGMTAQKKLEGVGDAVDGILEEHDFMDPGTYGQWEDYLHAAAKAKVSPTPANLKKLATMKKALEEDGVSDSAMKDKTSQLFKKMGWGSAASKKTVAQKKTVTKITATGKTEVTKITADTSKTKTPDINAPSGDVKQSDWDITLPGPGMYKDGNAILKLMNKPTTSPEQDAAKQKAVTKALDDFKAKHGNVFDPNAVELDHYAPTPAVPQLSSAFFDEAKALGYHHPDGHTDVTGGWKPPTHTRSALLGYTGEGAYSYTPINAQLRGQKAQTDAITKRVKLMDEAFADAPGLKEDTVTIRKMKTNGQFPAYPPPMTEGDEYTDYGYGSTSKSTSAWSGKVVMEVRIPKGTKAIDVNHNGVVSCSTSEQEILLPRGCTYRVIKDEMISGQRRITTEIVKTGSTHPKNTI
jgi:hypothetical protein